MRFSWLVLGCVGVLVACGGSVFTAGGTDSGGAAGLSEGGSSAGARDGSAGKPITPAGGAAHAGAAQGGAANGGSDSGGAAHGGAAQGGAATAGGSAGGAANAGAAGLADTSCPPMPPTVGKACVPDLYCSYGDDPRQWCRDRYGCGEVGKWTAAHPQVGTCAPLADCSTTPSGFPVIGHECKTVSEECTFDGGTSGTIYCRCNFCGDASSCPASMASWACAGPPIAPCPDTLPNEGQPCDKKMSCFYGVTCEGVTMACNGKTWSTESGGCAN
ncbi:MAG: hypothetical protein ABUL62_17755 [Myxococcales bacterium]